MYSTLIKVSLIGLTLSLTGCLSGGSGSEAGPDNSNNTVTQAKQTSDVSVHVRGVNDSRLSQVVVNVSEIELVIGQANKANRVVIAQNVGPLNLVNLSQGVSFLLSDLKIPEGVYVREIRMRLFNEGHYAAGVNGENCPMQTPSAQQSGLKLKLSDKMLVEPGARYQIVAEFDSNKSVVIKGNGECLLKPVIRLGELTKQVSDDDDQTPDPEVPVDPNLPEVPDTEEPVPGVDYIVDGDTVLIPQGDGTYIVIEGVDLSLISIEEILSIYGN